MNTKQNLIKGSLRIIVLLGVLGTAVLFNIFLVGSVHADPTGGITPPAWSLALPSDPCLLTGDKNCQYSSPALADINNDTFLEIIVATNNGHIVAVDHNHNILWDTDTAPYFGMAAGTQEIHSSPAVADIDNDGFLEIAVGTGTIYASVCTQGGLIVLDHNGQVKPGWPKLAADGDVPPVGCRDTIFSSPAIGDLDKDGDLEIVAAGFDKRIYAWHHTGTLVAGYPPDSALHERFPTWPNLNDQLGDDTWGSPALADLDNDGYPEVIIGTGEGNFDDSYPNGVGWVCPYASPAGWAPGYCGGSVYAFDRFGEPKHGFPRYFLEEISSTPAVIDINDDGKQEFFMGLGQFYNLYSPDHPQYGFMVLGLDGQGNNLPGWPQPTGGNVVVSPSLGDIAGDSAPEVIVIADDRKLYAWNLNGTLVPGFPMTPRDQNGNASSPFNTQMGLVLGDFDGDGKMEIFLNQSWTVNVVDGNGQQLTGTNFPNNTQPIYYANGTLINTPAVGDIDNDGKLELIASNSKLYVWDLNNSSDLADWPVFKKNASRTSANQEPGLIVTPDCATYMAQIGSSTPVVAYLNLSNSGPGSFDWQASITPATGITMLPTAGTVISENTVQVRINPAGLSAGMHEFVVTIEGSTDGRVVSGSPVQVVVQVLVVNNLYKTFVPMIPNN